MEKGNLLQDIPYRKGTADFQAAEEQERMKKIIFSCVVLVLCIFSYHFLAGNIPVGEENDFVDVMQGDFSKVDGLTEDEVREMEVFFENLDEIDDTKWIFRDLNSDGTQELLLVQNRGGSDEPGRIHAAFRTEGKYRRILWDCSDSGECYIPGRENLIYCTQYQGIFQYKSYTECCFDETWEMTMLGKLEIFRVTDLEEWNGIPDHFLSLERPEVESEGIYYCMISDCRNGSDKKMLTETEWIERVETMVGAPFDAVKPEWYEKAGL